MKHFLFAMSALLVAGSCFPAFAEDTERYRLEKSQDGYIRMNTATGQMSICQERGSQLVCKMAVEERAAFQDEIDRLQTRIDTLEERVAGLESRPSLPQELLPSQDELDKTMDFMERFFHRFMGMAKELKDGDAPGPDRT